MRIMMTILTKFISTIYCVLKKTGNLSPEFSACAFISLLFSANLTGFIYVIIIVSNISNFISKEVRYLIFFFIWLILYFFIKDLFKKSENKIINFKVSAKEYIYTFAFVLILIVLFIIIANFTRSRF